MKPCKLFLLFVITLVSLNACAGLGEEDQPSEKPIPVNPEVQVNDGDYTISDGKISYKVLRNYLSRAVTEAEFLSVKGYTSDAYVSTADDERMLKNIGAKFIGRALYTWNGEQKFNQAAWLDAAETKIRNFHSYDPDVIFQAALFETVSKVGVEQVKIPDWVFSAFGKSPEDRTFKFDNIRNKDGQYLNQWGEGTCVPDMSREEAQMWFYYMAVRYMEIGIEALHMGQVNLMCSMGDAGNGYAGWMKMQSLIREAAKTKARRGIVLMDAHCAGIAVDGKHLFDFVSYPLRLKEIEGSSKKEAKLEIGYLDSILGKTIAGTTPSGWYAARLPYLLEFDNFGTSTHPGIPAQDHFVWGYDEISWLGLVSEDYARQVVGELVAFMEKTDPVGYIQMPGCRVTATPYKSGYYSYLCNTKSPACPTGRNLETTIKDLWK